jgi:O-antigen/teichoic acid export membrane protein
MSECLNFTKVSVKPITSCGVNQWLESLININATGLNMQQDSSERPANDVQELASVRRSLVLSFIERYALIVLTLGSYLIIARLLTPEEIGLYSVASAVIGVAQVVREFGVGSFLIQEKNLTEDHVRTAFGLSLMIGSVFFVIFLIGAPFAGNFYNDHRVVDVLRLISINFLVLPFCSISISLLRREMAFGRIMLVNVAAGVIGFVVVMGFAFAKFGYLSLAFGAIATNASTGLFAWIVRSDRKILTPSLKNWRRLAHFGGQSAAANVVTEVSMNMNDLVIGRVLGFSSVAMLSRAQGLMNLFNRDVMAAVRNVAYPAFAQAHRAGYELEPRYIQSVAAVTVIAWPFYGFVAMFPLEILRLMFGTQWDAAAPLVPWFCLAGGLAATWNLISSAVLATGRVDLVTRTELVIQPVRAVILVMTAVYFKSLLACAIAFAMIYLLLFTPAFYAMKSRSIPNQRAELFKALLVSLKITIGCLFVPALYLAYVESAGDKSIGIPTLISLGVVCALTWVTGIVWFKHNISRDPLFQRILSRLQLTKKIFPDTNE